MASSDLAPNMASSEPQHGFTVNGATASTMAKNLASTLARQRRPWPSLRKVVKFREQQRFDTRQLPPDLRRVVAKLTEEYTEEYALHVAFTVRTAVELHRAWNMTLLTSALLEQASLELEGAVWPAALPLLPLAFTLLPRTHPLAAHFARSRS